MALAHDDSGPDYSVGLIDDELIQRLPQQQGGSDNTLYESLGAMLGEEMETSQDASRKALTIENATSEGEEDGNRERFSDLRSLSVAQALYRGEEKLDGPQSEPRRPGRDVQGRLQRERRFKYGGPSNEPEEWNSNFPATLPFPETHQMAHWESLKIDFDLSESGKKQKAEGKVVETNISFDHPALQQYKNISLYDSGSRFKLPTPPEDVRDEINRLGTTYRLAKVVDGFNRGDVREDPTKDYAPRIFQDRLTVRNQESPTNVRRAVNVTPTKPRTKLAHSSAQSSTSQSFDRGPSTAKNQSAHLNREDQAASTMILNSNDPPSDELPVPTSQIRGNRVFLAGETLRTVKEETRLEEKKASAAREKIRKAALDARRIADQVNLGKLPSDIRASSPVVRKIDRERTISIEKSPRRQSGITTAPQSPEKTPTKTADHPKAVIPQRRDDISHGSVTLTTNTPQRTTRPTDIPAPKSTGKTPVKRKRSIGGKAYTPERKRPEIATPSSLKKGTRAKKQTVCFDSKNDSGDKISDNAIIITPEKRENGVKKASKFAKVATPESKAKPRGSFAKTPEAKKKVGKAGSVGKAAGESASKTKIKKVMEEVVDDDESEPRTEVRTKKTGDKPVKVGGTRSGAKYLK